MRAHLVQQITPEALDKAIVAKCSDSLYQFVRMAWPIIESTPFVDGKVVRVICAHLERVYRGEIKDTCINVPPGHTKSLITCVFWPVWVWIRKPHWRFIYTTYSDKLAQRDATRTINLLASRWFRARWGMLLRSDKEPTAFFHLKAGGWRLSTTLKGQVTGHHAHVHVCDDPHKPLDASRPIPTLVELDNAFTVWTGTMPTRCVDPAELRRVIIMQRLHQQDLSGRMTKAGYYTLRLPARFEAKHACHEDWRKVEGELLWPERFPEAALATLEATLSQLSPAHVAAQLQQRPTPAGGLVFKQEWFKYWHYKPGVAAPDGQLCEVLPKYLLKFLSWDLAFKGGDGSDRVAGSCWGQDGPNLYLLDVDVATMTFTEALEAFVAMVRKWPDATEKLVEDKANGPALENVLRKHIAGINLVDPKGSKPARASAASSVIKSGHVYLPHPDLFSWVNPYIDELLSFPFSGYDDQVDMTSQALIRVQSSWALYANAIDKTSLKPTG